MSKRTKAEWKAKQQWRADLEARHAEQERRQTIKRLTSDLPVNSRISIDIVDDPLSSRGEKIPVVRSVRDDPLADMFARGVIDQAMLNAGREWQRLFEAIEIGPIGAVDTTKEPVDGRGPVRDPITQKYVVAVKRLKDVQLLLGDAGNALMVDFLGHGMPLRKMYEKYQCTTARRMTYLSQRVRECLDDMAVHFGLAGRTSERSRASGAS